MLVTRDCRVVEDKRVEKKEKKKKATLNSKVGWVCRRRLANSSKDLHSSILGWLDAGPL